MYNMADLLPIKLLIVEDFHVETEALLRELYDAEFNFSHVIVKDETSFRKALVDFVPDVILSPYSLKKTNAVKLLGISRNHGLLTPFILLAYDLSEDIAIDLLGQGIEDYVLRSTIKRLPVAIKKALQRYKTQLELRISESRIRNSEASLRSMLRNGPMAVAMFDMEMCYIVVSERWLEHENKTEQDLIGKSHYDVMPEIPEAWKKVHQECLAGATRSASHEEMIRADGTIQILRWKMNPWYDADGKIGGVVLFVDDVTEQVRSRQRIEEQTLQKDLILTTAKIGVWHWVIGDSKLVWDEQCAQLFDYDKTDISTEAFYELIHEDDRDPVRNALIHSLKNGDYSTEYRLKKGDETRYVLSRGRSTIGKDGRAIRMDGILIDMTERHRLEAAQKESEQLFRDMAENISEVFWLTDWKLNKVLYASPLYESLYGSPVEELYNDSKSWVKNIHPEDREFVTKEFQKKATTGEYDIEYRILNPQGGVKWVRDRSFAVLDADGNVVRVAGITEEITERKRDKEWIETLSMVASEASNGVMIQDAGGLLIWANNGFSEISGYRAKEVLGKEPWSLLAGDKTDYKLIEATYAQLKKGISLNADYRVLRKDGQSLWVHVSFSPIMDGMGNLKQIVSIGTDITRHQVTS